MTAVDVHEYCTADGAVPFARWLERLSDHRARAAILARIDRLKAGLCGGNKRTQSRDIEVSHDYWKDYQERRAKPTVSGRRLSPR
jgi:putative component of toxin-antitoxin plasmid stabilization module